MWVFSFFTFLVALAALILTVAQFITRHRPFVGVSSVKLAPNELGLEVIATIHNWGEVTGENVRVTTGPYTYLNTTIPQQMQGRSAGDLFPGQSARLSEHLSEEIFEDHFELEGDLLVRIEISYTNPVHRLLPIREAGRYQKTQNFWVTQHDWGVMAE